MNIPETPAAIAQFSALKQRILADSSDRVAWLRARRAGVTATDAAKLATDNSVLWVAEEKIHGRVPIPNSFLRHGRKREPILANWVLDHYSIAPSQALFRAAAHTQHLATPDGLAVEPDGKIVLAEIKTTNKPWRSIPKNYLRQVWWQQYVLGAERTLLVWEEHQNFVPVLSAPECRWIDRDDAEINTLIKRANTLLTYIHRN